MNKRLIASNQMEDFIGALMRRDTFCLLILITVGVVGCRSDSGTSAAVPATVTVAKPATQSVTEYLNFTGNTAATDSVTLVARVEGYLEKIHFKDGAPVKTGDLLFTIQQDQYKAKLQQANAQVAAQAQVELAKLNLGYTQIKSPFDGRICRHLVDPGNVVGAAGVRTALADIDRIDPLYVYFTINERDLLRVIEHRKQTSAPPIVERRIPVFFGLSNEAGYPHEGRLDFASISVAQTTGTLQARGIF